MDTSAAILSLIADLYASNAALRQQNEALGAELARVRSEAADPQ